MNAPTPVSALNVLARPERSASPQASTNDSGPSFSSALEQQKKAVAQNEKPSNTTRPTESKPETANEQTVNEPNSHANKSTEQEAEQSARSEASAEKAVSDTTSSDKQAEDDKLRGNEEKQLAAAAQTKASLESLIHGLPATTVEKVIGQPAASDPKHALEINPAITEKTAKRSISANEILVDKSATNPVKSRPATLGETQQALNDASVNGKSNREASLLSVQTAGHQAGAAIVKNNGRADTTQTELLNGRISAHRLDGTNPQQIEAAFNRSENTSAFLDRVVEARRISGQQLLQSTLHSDIAAITADRTAGGSEAVSGILMGSPNTTAFSLGSATVSTPVGHPQWGRDFSQQVSSFGQHLKNGLQTIELRLDPPDLGPIRISLSMSDNVAQASFISPHAAVRHAVEQALPQLQEQLAQAGISLGQTSVGEQHQPGQGSQHTAMSNTTTTASSSGDAHAADETAQPQIAAQRSHNGQVDTFA
ncbi:flagellar hook-length control protein FliK [Neopusillimonas maritima]|uniref:Flagellar hook-length control protein-like C-terminal domain-containing protein n=1 Tax=Neopusillimonas maritima TaxID=2026239 RepID=A0A3A1YNS8_9BURK|nr:flagellar hook-length control protein FliK [Neopusillimonas maritima]RIY39923.1 hypothetical protein CJP73_12630 [Neopusillimonas maritima]